MFFQTMGKRLVRKFKRFLKEQSIPLLVLAAAIVSTVIVLHSQNRTSCPDYEFHIFLEGSEPVIHSRETIYKMFPAPKDGAGEYVSPDQNGAFSSEITIPAQQD